MRKLLSIPLILLVILSGSTINLASHFCQGRVVATKVTFSGELASCGMEEGHTDSQGINKTHICSDQLSSFTFSNTYVPSSTLLNNVIGLIHSTDYLIESSFSQSRPLAIIFNNKRPPGTFAPSGVDLEAICIYRI